MTRDVTRRKFLRDMSVGSLGAVSAVELLASKDSSAASSAGRKPNIIFILADDLGYGDVGCYGQKTIKTPSLDRMAREGMRFTQCYAGSTVCAPSRCCLMTGYHTGHARVRGNKRHPLLPEDVTVAEILKEKGYATGIIGKWGIGEPETTGIPNKQGFDEWFGYLNQHHAHNYYPDLVWKNTTMHFLDNKKYSHDEFTREGLDFVKRHKDHPFFLYLAYTIPHANNEKGKEGMEVPSDEPYTNEPWPQQQKNHAAMITRLDRDVGQLFALLKELGIDEDTIVFFSSDNGPHREGGADPEFFNSSGPLRGIKRDLYEGGIRVPTMVRWPGKIQAGSVSDGVWAFWDFPPTAAELAGTKAPRGIDGISIVPALMGKPLPNREYLYWEFHERGFKQAVRMGDWKGVRLGLEKPIELYNLKDDIAEKSNIAGRNPSIVARIETILANARTESKYYPIRRA